MKYIFSAIGRVGIRLGLSAEILTLDKTNMLPPRGDALTVGLFGRIMAVKEDEVFVMKLMWGKGHAGGKLIPWRLFECASSA